MKKFFKILGIVIIVVIVLAGGVIVYTNDIANYIGKIAGAAGGSSNTNGNACTVTTCCSGAACPLIQANNANKGRCESLSTSAIPDKGIIFVANNAWVEGTINNRRVSVVAAELPDEPNYTGGAKNIFLGINNLLYSNTDGKDVIGLPYH